MAANSKSDKSKSADKKIFDVAKPGKSAPSTTTRPIIVGHKPMIQDPMVNASEVSADDASSVEAEKSVTVRGTKKIVPLHEKETGKTESDDEKKDESALDESGSSADTADEPKHEDNNAPSADTADEVPKTDDAAAVDAFASQVTKKKEGELSEEEKKQAETIQKLIADKTYYVKIGQAHRSRNNTLFIILFLIIIVAAGIVLAIDAGMVQTNITLPFDLISN